MTYALAILNALTLVVLFVLSDRRDKRLFDQLQAERLERAGMQATHKQELERLIVQVQRPDMGAALAQQEIIQPARTLPLSDEEMAERMEMIRRIEAEENASLT